MNYYEQFHTGDILKNAEGYYKFGSYCNSVVDLIIIVTANALNLNLSIYQQLPHGNIPIIEQTMDTRSREVHLKFMCDPHKTNNHHDAILLFHKPAKLCQEEEDYFQRPGPSSLQPVMQDDVDEVIDLTSDSETTFM